MHGHDKAEHTTTDPCTYFKGSMSETGPAPSQIDIPNKHIIGSIIIVRARATMASGRP